MWHILISNLQYPKMHSYLTVYSSVSNCRKHERILSKLLSVLNMEVDKQSWIFSGCCFILCQSPVFLTLCSAFCMSLYGLVYKLIASDIAISTVTITRGILQVRQKQMFWTFSHHFTCFQVLINGLISIAFKDGFRFNNVTSDKSQTRIFGSWVMVMTLGGTRSTHWSRDIFNY